MQDFEYREELNDLGLVVSRCDNLVFVLTDNIFESKWCLEELASAVKHKARRRTAHFSCLCCSGA